MSKLTCISAVLVVSGLLAGCDPAMTPDRTGEGPADALSNGAGTGFGTAEQGLIVINAKWWYGTVQPVVDQGSALDRVCFLNKMTGNFDAAGNTIGTTTLWGRWYLGGNAGAPGVGALARCVSATAGSYTQEYSWQQGDAAVNLGSGNGRVCFLTQVQGNFNGWVERVETYLSGGNWYLGGSSNTAGVGAKARCVNVPSYSGEYSWNQSMSSPVRMDSGETTRACALTYVKGKFRGTGEWVEVYPENGSWYLGGGSQQVDVAAKAVCF